jgi:hypothetical protein
VCLNRPKRVGCVGAPVTCAAGFADGRDGGSARGCRFAVGPWGRSRMQTRLHRRRQGRGRLNHAAVDASEDPRRDAYVRSPARQRQRLGTAADRAPAGWTAGRRLVADHPPGSTEGILRRAPSREPRSPRTVARAATAPRRRSTAERVAGGRRHRAPSVARDSQTQKSNVSASRRRISTRRRGGALFKRRSRYERGSRSTADKRTPLGTRFP